MIGTERALYLVGQLPRCWAGSPGKQSSRVILYVPKSLKPDDQLVRILGYREAARLVDAFGGEILQPANCAEVYRRFRDASIVRLAGGGASVGELAELMQVSERHVRNLLREIPQQDRPAANDNNPATNDRQASREWTS